MGNVKSDITDICSKSLMSICISKYEINTVESVDEDFTMRQERETRLAASASIGIVLSKSDDDISTKNGFMESKFFRQRFFFPNWVLIGDFVRSWVVEMSLHRLIYCFCICCKQCSKSCSCIEYEETDSSYDCRC